MYWLGIILFLVATILNFSGLLEYYYIMKVVYLYCAILSILIFVEGYYYIRRQDAISKLLLFGVCFFSVTFTCDCIRFLSELPDDICAYTRVGFLVFIICILIEVCDKAIHTMRQGVLADFYKKMADTDTLTSLHNRNALLYDESKYNELIRSNKHVGIVMFDVNNLKYINDTFGHDKGDLLIKKTANIIEETFGHLGKCYRTGGDEFVTVFSCEDINNEYNKSLDTFLNKLKEVNKENEHKNNPLESAYGVYISNDENIGTIWQKADELMYAKKKEMKALASNTNRK